MYMKLHSPSIQDFDPLPAIRLWNSSSKKRLLSMNIKTGQTSKKDNVNMNKSMNEAIVIASEQVEEINENFVMEEVNSEDKPDIPSRSQPADDYDDSDDYSDNDDYGDEGRVYRVMCREGIIEE